MNKVTCDYCGQLAELVTGKDVYPHRDDLAVLNFWRCKPCKAWVGCHQAYRNGRGRGDGTMPLGRLANNELRKLKNNTHNRFDRLWLHGPMTRTQAYTWLSEQLGIPFRDCHIGMFDERLCRMAITAVHIWQEEQETGNACYT